MQKYEPLVQEDLNLGTERVWVQAPGRGKLRSTQIGLHSFARGRREYEKAWTPGAIAAGSKTSTTVTVPDAATSDVVLASHDKILTSAIKITAHVSAADTVTVVLHNPGSASVTVAAGTVSVIVFPFIASAGAYEDLAGSFVIDVNGAGATGGSGIQSTGWTGTPTITGGSGSFTYAWVIWNEYTSEGSPLYTSSDEVANIAPDIDASCNGQATLVVTDIVTALTLELGPENWDWDCV